MKHIAFLTVFVFTVAPLGCKGSKGGREMAGESADPKATLDEKAPSKEKNEATEIKKEAAASAVDQSADATKAPEEFAVKLDTTKGEIVIDVNRSWAPRGVDRFYELVKAGYYDDVAFFRVIEGFMAQTGISGDPAKNAEWRVKRIPDDPVGQSNKRGMMSFAMAGPNSRTTQFFISFDDNSNLDQMGFAPFGKVRDMTAVDKLYSGYGEGAPRGRGPSQKRTQMEGNSYLKKEFPELDYIKTARVIEP